MSDTVTSATDTRTALLDAGERLFAERGFAGASMRAITRAAGVNLAAVHYHFGSKEGLVREVFRRRLEPLNRERLERLEKIVAPGGVPPVEGIVEAFVAPPLRMIGREPGGRSFAQLLARAVMEPGPASRDVVLEQFEAVIDRFTSALAAALPHLTSEEVLWRFHFMIGSLSFTAGLGFLVERRAGVPVADDPAPVIARLVDFLTGGMERRPTASGERA